uniref:Kunitz peptide n=1 Tax=Calliophis bivirgatus TaxID=8633 RepID=A0A898INA1_CALBG|nr:kunitz peptide [Calliophis bivirgatus]
MSSGSLLLLLGLLTLWAELTPVSSKPRPRPRPEFCDKFYDFAHCYTGKMAFYFNWVTKKCQPFRFGGCIFNPNTFKTIEECKYICLG